MVVIYLNTLVAWLKGHTCLCRWKFPRLWDRPVCRREPRTVQWCDLRGLASCFQSAFFNLKCSWLQRKCHCGIPKGILRSNQHVSSVNMKINFFFKVIRFCADRGCGRFLCSSGVSVTKCKSLKEMCYYFCNPNNLRLKFFLFFFLKRNYYFSEFIHLLAMYVILLNIKIIMFSHQKGPGS